MSDYTSSIDLVPYYPNFPNNRVSTSAPSPTTLSTSHIIVSPHQTGNRYTPAPSRSTSYRTTGDSNSYAPTRHTPAVSNALAGTTCNYDADCQNGLWCNPDPTSTTNGSICSMAGSGNIGRSCSTASGCLVGLGCYSDQGSTCQAQDIIGAQPIASAPAAAGGQCNFASDCATGMDCINFKCQVDPYSTLTISKFSSGQSPNYIYNPIINAGRPLHM